MRLGELEEIFECDPEGTPLNPQWVEDEPEPAAMPVTEPEKEKVKVGNYQSAIQSASSRDTIKSCIANV